MNVNVHSWTSSPPKKILIQTGACPHFLKKKKKTFIEVFFLIFHKSIFYIKINCPETLHAPSYTSSPHICMRFPGIPLYWLNLSTIQLLGQFFFQDVGSPYYIA